MPPVPTPRLKLRRDTADRWMEVDPILADGEPGFEKYTGLFKIGNGIKRWSELAYFMPYDPTDVSNVTLPEHVNSEDPHPVYDDGRSFLLLYENAKV